MSIAFSPSLFFANERMSLWLQQNPTGNYGRTVAHSFVLSATNRLQTIICAHRCASGSMGTKGNNLLPISYEKVSFV